MATRIPTIHRGSAASPRWFTFNGRRYAVSPTWDDVRAPEWEGYRIEAVLSDQPGDWVTVDEGFWRLGDVRDLLRRAVDEGWDYLPNVDGYDPFWPKLDERFRSRFGGGVIYQVQDVLDETDVVMLVAEQLDMEQDVVQARPVPMPVFLGSYERLGV